MSAGYGVQIVELVGLKQQDPAFWVLNLRAGGGFGVP